MVDVPCNGCVACCKASEAPRRLLDGEDPEDYETYDLPDESKALKTKSNGDCIYLGETGCVIHDRAPVFCSRYDCREVYSRYSDGTRTVLASRYPELRDIFAAAERLNASDQG